MIPWELLDRAAVPGGGEMRLYRRGAEYSIRVGNYELMNSRVHASEDALASLACARLRDCRAPRILIGGLGMGFTLAAVLKEVGADARVVVAELVPEVVAWHRGPLASVAPGALDDPRVEVRTSDVAAVIAERSRAFDAILLDVDNGPRGLTADANDGLYSVRGLRAAGAALREGGLLAVWSAGPDAAFVRRLGQAGFDAEELPVRGRDAKRGPRFLIWIARKNS
jgi:spermidine synthase